MAKGIGYYEHDIKVRFTEERINKSSNWQWLIECTEERFSAPKEITSVNEFIGVLASLHEPFAFLATVVDLVGDFKPRYFINVVGKVVRLRPPQKWNDQARRF